MQCSIAISGAGCGTLAPADTPPTGLPSSGTGPFVKLEAEREELYSEAGASVDDAQLLVDGDRFAVWFTRRKATDVRIERARFRSLDDTAAPEALADELGDGVFSTRGASQPAVLRGEGGDPWILCVVRDGRIECATSTDGDRFTAAPALQLSPEAGSEPGDLASPALLRLSDRVRLLYVVGTGASAGLFAADAPRPVGTGPFARVDGDPSTPARDPVLAARAATWLETLGRVSARTVTTPAGRPRYDLFVTGAVATARVCGLAASWDGMRFGVAAAPFLDPKAPDEWAPTAAAYRDGTLLVFSQRSVGGSSLGLAIGP